MTTEKTKLLLQQQNSSDCTSANNNDNTCNGMVIIITSQKRKLQQQKYGIIILIVLLMIVLIIYSYPPATLLYKKHKNKNKQNNGFDNYYYSNSIRFVSTDTTPESTQTATSTSTSTSTSSTTEKSSTKKKSTSKSETTSSSTTTITTTPVFGILAQPISKAWDPSIKKDKQSTNTTKNTANSNEYDNYYIAASYIKWLEVNGIRTIPIPYDTINVTVLDELFYEINGILLPGGGSTIPFAIEYLFSKTIISNIQEKIFFPIWGTCLGFEFIIQFFGCNNIQDILQNNITYSFNSTNPNSILETGYLTENISLPLLNVQRTIPNTNNNTNNTNDDTYYRNGLYNDKTIYNIVTNYNVTMNNHFLGISPNTFVNNTNLNNIFYITSTNIDDKSNTNTSILPLEEKKQFVSTIEPIDSNSLPIYGIQYHPEKNTFEYSTYPNTNIPVEAINHSNEGITMSLYLSQYIRTQLADRAIQEQYKNGNKHIYTGKFPTVTTYPIYPSLYFEQMYIIPRY